MISFSTTDLCDAHETWIDEGRLGILTPGYVQLGRQSAFCGPAQTVKVFEDNALVRTALEQRVDGHVLIVDGGGSLRCALVGGNLAQLAVRNGWAGIVVYGCVRDAEEIADTQLGVRALALHPKRSVKAGAGSTGLAVTFSGVTIRPGDWIYADTDGILVARDSLHALATSTP